MEDSASSKGAVTFEPGLVDILKQAQGKIR